MNNNKSLTPYLVYQTSLVLACVLFYILPLNSAADNTPSIAGLNTPPPTLPTINKEINILIAKIEHEKNRINTTLLTHKNLKLYNDALVKLESANTYHKNQDFNAANSHYGASLALLNTVNKNIDKAHRRSIEQGFNAIKSGNSRIAISAFTRALAFRNTSEEAITGLERANKLNDVLEQIKRGDKARENGDLDTAIAAYNSALALDPETTLAQAKLKTIERLEKKKIFTTYMENGHEALNEENFSYAIKQYELAYKIEPNSTTAQSRLKFALREQKRNTILEHLGEALSAQQNKQWRAAIEHFDSALKLDPNLETAQAGKQHALDQLKNFN